MMDQTPMTDQPSVTDQVSAVDKAADTIMADLTNPLFLPCVNILRITTENHDGDTINRMARDLARFRTERFSGDRHAIDFHFFVIFAVPRISPVVYSCFWAAFPFRCAEYDRQLLLRNRSALCASVSYEMARGYWVEFELGNLPEVKEVL